jgi:hypothetical protein
MFGSHCLKTYSQTQETIAVSSGESEFYDIVKAATMGVGIKSMCTDLGVEVEVQLNTDSSSARGISSRRGAGTVRHVEVRELWVQERVCRGEWSISSAWRGQRRLRLDQACRAKQDGDVRGQVRICEASRAT